MTLWQFGRPRSRHHYVSTTTELIATKVGRMVTYLEGLLPIKSHRPLITLITWFCETTWQTISIYISTTTVPMTTRLSRVVINFERLLGIKSYGSWATWSCKISCKIKIIISPLPQPMVTILGRMVTYHEGLSLITSHDPLSICSCKIIRQIKTILSLQPQYLWPPNLAEWWLILRASTYKVSWLLNQVVLRGHVTNQKDISTTQYL